MSGLFGGISVPKPPPIPPPPKIPTVADQDTGKINQSRTRRAQANSTILGGMAGNDSNVQRPTLLGG